MNTSSFKKNSVDMFIDFLVFNSANNESTNSTNTNDGTLKMDFKLYARFINCIFMIKVA
jgi:hypothetical protein